MGVVNPQDYGANGTGGDDTTALLSAISYASSNGRVLYFPPGEYGTDETLPISGDGWKIFCDAPGSAKLLGLGNRPIFEIDVSAQNSSHGVMQNLGFRRNTGSYDETQAVHVKGGINSPTGLRHWRLSSLINYGGMEQVLDFDDTAKTMGTIGAHGFCLIDNLEVPYDPTGRLPAHTVRFQGSTGPHMSFMGGYYRSRESSLLAGVGEATDSQGDLILNNIVTVLGKYGLDIQGPSTVPDPNVYRYNISVTACQFDVVEDAPFRMKNVGLIRVLGTQGEGLPYVLDNCNEYIIEYNNVLTISSASRQQQMLAPFLFGKRATFSAFLNREQTVSTIVSGSVALSATYTALTYSGSGPVDLNTATGGTEGDELYLCLQSSTKPVTVNHGAKFKLNGGNDRLLSSVFDNLHFIMRGGVWCQVNGDNA